MKFEFKPYIRGKSHKLDSRDVTNQLLLDDLRKVANGDASKIITKSEYNAKGKYSYRTFEKRLVVGLKH
jgi:hypothetical protein